MASGLFVYGYRELSPLQSVNFLGKWHVLARIVTVTDIFYIAPLLYSDISVSFYWLHLDYWITDYLITNVLQYICCQELDSRRQFNVTSRTSRRIIVNNPSLQSASR